MESLVIERDLREHARINYTASLLGDCLTPRNDFFSVDFGFHVFFHVYILAMIDILLWCDDAGKSNSISNKEEKIHGYHHTFPGCIRMHFSYFYLLVDQVRISLCTRLEAACGETTLSFILFFCSKLNRGLYFLSKFIVTSQWSMLATPVAFMICHVKVDTEFV